MSKASPTRVRSRMSAKEATANRKAEALAAYVGVVVNTVKAACEAYLDQRVPVELIQQSLDVMQKGFVKAAAAGKDLDIGAEVYDLARGYKAAEVAVAQADGEGGEE